MPDLDPDTLEKARRAFEKMPPRTLAVFHARCVEGLSYAEIAERERLWMWQVRRHMARAIAIIDREMCAP